MYKELEKELQKNRISFDKGLLKKAFEFSKEAHKNQVRVSGEPFFSHSFGVAMILARMGLDINTIVAGLLHDTVEDTVVTKEDIEKEFGENIKNLVLGVTKLREMKFSKEDSLKPLSAREEVEIENFRKFFLAMAKDTRVMLIKLADRLHNLETLSAKPVESQKRVAKETLEIFAPLADRLGMGQLKVDLEDLAFFYYLPEEFKKVKIAVSKRLEDRKNYVEKLKNTLLEQLKKDGIKPIRIEGRAKHLYSIYKKLTKTDGDMDKIYDLMAVRVIVSEICDCYTSLGIIHQHYKPLIYRIKDYIAVPKPNGYQSLHTTVFGEEGIITEIQIRTPRMHEEAEMGIAAHWHYSQSKFKIYSKKKDVSFASKKDLDWVNQLAEIQNKTDNAELIESLKVDFFSDRIFVFSPKGNIFNLPVGATSVDFAYQVHSEIGDHCIGAKVNGKMMSLDYKLENRDIVEIITSSKAHPRRDWLNFVKTSVARQHVRSWFRRNSKEENSIIGADLLKTLLKVNGLTTGHIGKNILNFFNVKTLDEMHILIGEGQITTQQIIRKINEKSVNLSKVKEKNSFKGTKAIIKGTEGMMYGVANCCSPKFGDKITGYVTLGKGITIHKSSCKNVLNKNKEKMVAVSWQFDQTIYQVPIIIKAKNRVGLLKDVTFILAEKEINIGPIRGKQEDEIFVIDIVLEVEKIESLSVVLNSIMAINDVISVKRSR